MQFPLKSDKSKGTLREDQYTFLIISPSVLLRIKNVSDKIGGENHNILFISNNIFFSKIVQFMIYCGNILYSQTGHR
jgi:hypothetical protein